MTVCQTGVGGNRAQGLFETHLLIGAGKVEQGVQAHSRLLHARAHAMQRCRLIDWRVHDPLMHQPLDLVQQRLALAPVALPRLLAEELIDIRIAAVGVGPVLST